MFPVYKTGNNGLKLQQTYFNIRSSFLKVKIASLWNSLAALRNSVGKCLPAMMIDHK